MVTVFLQVLAVVAFFVMTLVVGAGIRRAPTKDTAERLSRVSHAFFWASLVPLYLGAVTPGLTHFDELLGLPPLPFAVARWVVGGVLLLPGLYYSSASMKALRRLGSGMMAFKLTKQVVNADVYEQVRNPMSLGLYLQFTAVALLVGSTWLLLYVLFLYGPAHAFNLKYFEERELSARHGPSYDEYRQRVPFLIPRLGAR